MTDTLSQLGISSTNNGAFGNDEINTKGAALISYSPINGNEIASVKIADASDFERVTTESQELFREWRKVPAPQRGQIVREIGNALRDQKQDLAKLLTMEMGKILAESEGEVQEAIDIADFAVGLSRQLYGKTMHSERPAHRMYEQWHPLGPVGVITAFNFPVAVWAWNAMVAAVCGNTLVWKPSECTPLVSIAVNNIARKVAAQHGFEGVFSLLIDNGPELGKKMAKDSRYPLISATGSCRMGRSVAEEVGKRLGRSLLELGGNNAIIAARDADLDLLVPSVLFGAVGTAGQRCTSTRRLLIEEEIADEVLKRLSHSYSQVKIGNPLDPNTLMGPLIHQQAVDSFEQALGIIKEQGGEIIYGGEKCSDMPSNLYVQPTIVKASHDMPIVFEETFAPILYVIPVKSLSDAFSLHNSVSQGLSSAIFTRNLRSAEEFLSAWGSDCGIANVNIGTSGAEIGGAFGGEKDTGGGRESGSDSWKQYMRRQTNTINFSKELPLAQGISFEVKNG